MLNPKIKVIEGIDRTGDLKKSLAALTKRQVLVGVPQAQAQRKQGNNRVNNAALAYIHDNGSPQQNIPQREFLRPGIKNSQEQIALRFKQTARKALNGNLEDIEKGLTGAGLIAQKSIRKKITDGPFAPLKPATIKARTRRHKGRNSIKVTPLIDTGQLRQAINFVIVDKK